MKNTKFIFVTGGVVSGLGKGITAASIGRLMKQRGYKVAMQKLDPYINVDPGLMHPSEHGETYVTFDGGETDLDLGHYERFIDEKLTKNSSVTTGKIYQKVIRKERNGKYKGKTVQLIPHVTNEIKSSIKKIVKDNSSEINIIEIGGTVGDMESFPFLETIRQMRNELGKENTLFIHCTLVPFLNTSKEHKSKPTQQSVATLRSLGIQPDILVTRSETHIAEKVRKKIAMFSNISSKKVIEAVTNPVIYDVVNKLADQNLDKLILKHFNLIVKRRNKLIWDKLIKNVSSLDKKVNIALVGKYRMIDSYLSVIEALKHAGYDYGIDVKVEFIYSGGINVKNVNSKLQNYDGILVPGGFGIRGTHGKILAIKYARENKIPFLGICYGMQLMVIEYAKNVLGIKDANTTEINQTTKHPVIDIIHGKTSKIRSGILRIGETIAELIPGTIAQECYGSNIKTIAERHRHKYELTTKAFDHYFAKSDIRIGAIDKKTNTLIEIVENKSHPFMVALQFHGELVSRPTRPHPLYIGFIKATKKHTR